MERIMKKIIKRDYPFTVIIDDKISKKSGKQYQAISIAYTSVKNKDATDTKEKYKTMYFNFFDGVDLLKLSSLCENSYIELTKQRGEERKSKKQETTHTSTASVDLPDDDIPF